MTDLPNFITLARLFSVPLIVWLVASGHLEAAFWAFVVAGISDAVDGVIARRWNLSSRIGAILDPVADKALLMSSFIVLAIYDFVPLWLVILVVSRDLLILGGFYVSGLLGQQVEVQPLMISKINTVVQIGMVGLVLGDAALDLVLLPAVEALTYVVALTTFTSGLAYLKLWITEQSGMESEPPEATTPKEEKKE
jgi:cardiolipin synthase